MIRKSGSTKLIAQNFLNSTSNMTLVKRQHYVPRTYLKNFAEPNGKEYIISALPKSDLKSDKIFKASIKNIALENDLYTMPGETEEQKMIIEKFYANEFEKYYEEIYKLLTDEKTTTITTEQRELIISTVITMYYRTTHWINKSKALMSRVFHRLFILCEQTGKDYFMFEDEKISIAGKTAEQFTKEYNTDRQPLMILTQLETAMKLIKLKVENSSIMVSKLVDENFEFITSDNPVIARNPYEKEFIPFDSNNIFYLPLDSNHMLKLIPEMKQGMENRIFRRQSDHILSKFDTLVNNQSQFESSENFLFGSDAGLKSYLSLRDEFKELQ